MSDLNISSASTNSQAEIHQSFDFRRSQWIESLAIEVMEFEHRQTGALHYHIQADNDENVFLVAVRTMPEDSTGVAHILEHTVLCGSERYPVRDPFFMMTRRSLNTFMNAFTSSDWTAYPFASQNRKDFFNLLDVYLDAVFFSRLDPLDFAQEGHRVEFEDPENPESPLVYKGVVFNEMKGAMSSPVSTLWQTITRYLFPQTTYHHNSGGEPSCIPDLTYDDLLHFYRSHYHPSNAVIMTFGNLPVSEIQERIDTLALSRFQRSELMLQVEDEKRYFSPVRVEEGYACDQPSMEKQTHHVMGWLLPRSIDTEALMEAHLLSQVLLDNSSSPLRAALESSELGSSPSPMCGLEDSNREMSFLCGIEGSEPEHADAFETLVLETLQQIVEDGVDQSMVEAQLHQLELSQREITGDGMPFGLQLILAGLSAGIHRGDPLKALNIDPALESLREKVKSPDFIPSLIKRWLLDNPHRVRVTLRPDAELSVRREEAEKARLSAIKAELSTEQAQAIVERAKALEARQLQIDDDSVLPCVTLEDVPVELNFPTQVGLPNLSKGSCWYAAGTNGLSYQQVIVELPDLSEAELQLLPLYSHCLTELGCGDRNYRENQAYQSEISGSFSASCSVRGEPEDAQKVSGFLVLSGKALAVNQHRLADLMAETLNAARFDEHKRIKEIVSQMRSRRVNSITGRGHALAMQAASANFSPAAKLSHITSGLEGIRRLKALDNSLADNSELNTLAESMAALHQRIKSAPRRYLMVGEAEHQQAMDTAYQQVNQALPDVHSDFVAISLPETRSAVQQIWITDTQVNFCAMAFPTVTSSHPDAAALTVLGDYLRNGYLHRSIREKGGAYGGGAAQDNSDAVFRFYSYRDPRIEGTLADFLAAKEWLLSELPDPKKVEEAILGVVSSIDKPGSPAGEAKKDFHAELFGRTQEMRKAFRARILSVTGEDLQRVAKTWLIPEKQSVAILSNTKLSSDLPESYERIEI
ncbi:insulinase family protein [Nitrincola schmidtii]|uniref:insulinase family protein n=1 Tax=Nitrincola schmidtii TaxID=1730894 RepID=UPI00124D70F6|nr:insulinase family protein [Nitrincola schmidtii]